MILVEEIPRRYLKRVKREHNQLRVEVETVKRWIFKRDRIVVLCNCHWRYSEDIAILPIEAMMITHYLTRTAMENHVISEAIKLGWKPKERY